MADYNDLSVMRSAVNWSFKDTQLKFYEQATAEYGNYILALQGINKDGPLSEYRSKFISSLMAYYSTVLNGFGAFLKDSDEYKEDFPLPEYRFTKEDFNYINITAADRNKLLMMCEVLFYWSQQYGPFATLTKHIDPGNSWAEG